MKTFVRIILILVLIPTVGIIIAAVAGSLLSNSELADENATLKKELAELQVKVYQLENEPEVLYSKAIELKNTNRFKEGIATLKELNEKYPDYQPDEVSESMARFVEAENHFKEAEAERKRAEVEKIEMQRLEQERIALEKKREAERQERERQRAMAAATRNLSKSTDEMREIDWFYDKSTPRTNNTRNVHAYIGKKGDYVWLRFKMSYNADDWLFVDSVAFKVDGEDFSLNYGLFDDWDRDNAGGGIWEWKDVNMDRRTWDLVRKIADSNKTMMRYNGRQYYSDREVTREEKQAMKNIILAYEAMGGEAPK
ncbi:hypothetical protein QEH59_18200 [Coraliomargarita sp. SDUM461004]|uniref:Tetratricopeptide repeat protein n=1 Tax=Thalassobacterium sedimentorum TaxID=3041258 RepID=A0ABU1AQ53_9BACT|nr:hypothetical protein [Coraliomargarita sp. SDUM461004]MDQ8196368.1 hypothetical protein [Coraliomargarita sp. SDUM461004]